MLHKAKWENIKKARIKSRPNPFNSQTSKSQSLKLFNLLDHTLLHLLSLILLQIADFLFALMNQSTLFHPSDFPDFINALCKCESKKITLDFY